MATSTKRHGATSPQALRRRIAVRDQASLLRLLTAAGASPAVRRRWTSVSLLLDMALRTARPGGRQVEARELPALLEGCLRDDPRVFGQEDFLPNDPRDVVLARIGDDVVRLFPGSVERPVADVARWAMVARAVDPVLEPRLGFGVSHFTTVALRYTDHVIRALAPSWPVEGHEDGLGGLSADEVAAATALLAPPEPSSLLASPQLRAAADWATAESVRTLPFELTHPQSQFGRFLAVMLPDLDGAPRRFWLPPVFLPEATGYGVGELCREVAGTPDAEVRFRQLAADQVRRALRRFSSEVYGAPDLEHGPRVVSRDSVQWIARCSDTRAIAVQLVTSLGSRVPSIPVRPAAVRAAIDARQHPDRMVSVEMADGTARLGAGLDIVPLVIVATPGHIAVMQRPEAVSMSLDDLLWAASTADHETDLFLFCREMADPRRPRMFAFEGVNIWESWQAARKTLFPGAVAPSAITFAPHAANGEWTHSSGRADLERALAILGMPPTRDFVEVIDRDGPPEVYGWSSAAAIFDALGPVADESSPDLTSWVVHTGAVPAALRCMQPHWKGDDGELLYRLAGAFAFALDHIGDVWPEAHRGSGIAGYIIDIDGAPADQSTPIIVTASERTARPGGVVVTAQLHVGCAALAHLIDDDSTEGRRGMALVVRKLMEAAGVAATGCKAVFGAWQAIPPTLAVEIINTSTVVNSLPDAWPLDDALVSTADRAVADAVRAAGVEPGTYSGAEAKELDGKILAPAALALLNRLLSRHNLDDLLLVGARQLDRAVASMRRLEGDIRRARGMTLIWDPLARAEEQERTHLALRRSCETAVEAALMTRPSGSKPVDKIAWMEILAAAHAYLEATTRSEMVHHQLSPTAISIDSSYAIETIEDSAVTPTVAGDHTRKRVYQLDAEAYRLARITQRLDTAENRLEDSAEEAGVSPAIDEAMRTAYGVRATDILTVLVILASWPARPEGHVGRTDVAGAVKFILDATVLGEEQDGRSRAEAALAMITSSTAKLTAVEWKPWLARTRQHRLLTQPIVECSDGSLLWSPHLCRAVMNVYGGYVSQGLLPWTQPPPPKPVANALNDFRRRRNTQLERNVGKILTRAGYAVQERVKPSDPGRLGVPTLSTEIDAVAGRPGSRIVWLVEAKDLGDPIVTPDVRRHLDTFFVGHGKSPAYATQLDRKLADLDPYAARVAAALGLPDADGDDQYKVSPLFVTRRPAPAAFVGSGYLFTTINDMVRFIDQQEFEPT